MTEKHKFDLMETVPCRAAHITTRWEGETAVLSFPRFKQEWVRRGLSAMGLSKEVRLSLEEHGTAVWRLIDGKRTTREIIEKLADHFEGKAGYESRVATYLQRLQKDGFVRLTVRAV